MDLNQVTLPTVDLAASIAFYKRLGLLQIVDSPHYARFECPNGTSTLSLHAVGELPRGEGIVIYFECDDLDERVAALTAGGVVFDSAPQDQSWLWREARLTDPDGNRLCLFRAGENRRNPPWRI